MPTNRGRSSPGPDRSAQQGGQGAAFDELHREVGAMVRRPAQFVDGDDAGVLQLAANLRLLQEAPLHGGVGLVRRQQHLDRQFAVEDGVAAAQHRPHASLADLPENLVAADPRRCHRPRPRRHAL
jgi:hypothetical protein